MTRKEFIEELGGTVKTYDSTNAWGFGGSIGKSIKTDNGCHVLVATTYHRHTKGVNFIRVDAPANGNYSGRALIDVLDTSASRLKVLERVRNITNDSEYIERSKIYNS